MTTIKLQAEAKPTKQDRRRASAKAADEAARMGVPRMINLADKAGTTLLVSTRKAGRTDGRQDYYVRILGSDLSLRREVLVNGTAAWHRLTRGIGRAKDGSKPTIATKLGVRLRAEGMAL